MLSSWNESESSSDEHDEIESTAIEKHDKSTQTIHIASPSFLSDPNSIDIKVLEKRVCILEKKLGITSDEQKSFPSKVAIKGRYKRAYCIFEEVRGHDAAHCLNKKLDFKDKMAQVELHNACLKCLKSTHDTGNACNAKYNRCVVCEKNTSLKHTCTT